MNIKYFDCYSVKRVLMLNVVKLHSQKTMPFWQTTVLKKTGKCLLVFQRFPVFLLENFFSFSVFLALKSWKIKHWNKNRKQAIPLVSLIVKYPKKKGKKL